MLERREPTRDTLPALIRLKVTEAQRSLVAENAITLAQAPHEPGSVVMGLWDGNVAVGLMAMVDQSVSPFLEPGDDPQAAYLWRLLIGADHQRKGYGRKALDIAVAQARDWGRPRLLVGVVDQPESALDFYLGYGFTPTGRRIDSEIEICLELP